MSSYPKTSPPLITRARLVPLPEQGGSNASYAINTLGRTTNSPSRKKYGRTFFVSVFFLFLFFHVMMMSITRHAPSIPDPHAFVKWMTTTDVTESELDVPNTPRLPVVIRVIHSDYIESCEPLIKGDDDDTSTCNFKRKLRATTFGLAPENANSAEPAPVMNDSMWIDLSHYVFKDLYASQDLEGMELCLQVNSPGLNVRLLKHLKDPKEKVGNN
jgi:hypothetical protein